MGSALAKAFVDAGAIQPDQIYLYDRYDEVAARVRAQVGGHLASDPAGLCRACDVVFLGVKPQDLPALMAELREAAVDVEAFVSIAAGVALSTLRDGLGAGPQLIRTMPNRPALVGAGVTGVMFEPGAPGELRARLIELFEAAGQVVLLEDEALFDAVTAVSGSGPAYVFRMVEALIEGARQEGLSAEQARALAVSTVHGAAMLLIESGTDPTDERVAVSSPGGTTLAGLAAMKQGGFFDSVVAAVNAAAHRSRELGN